MVLFFVKSETAEHFVQKAHKDYTLQNAACPFITLKNLNGIIQTHTQRYSNFNPVIFYMAKNKNGRLNYHLSISSYPLFYL